MGFLEFLLIVLIVFVSIAIKSYGLSGVYEGVAMTRPLPRAQVEAIEKYNSYYQRLPEKSKTIFLRKVKQFNISKTYIPRRLATVSDEMKGMIASAAVQLTFGLPRVTLRHFNKILVYPDEYYSVINRQYHKGEVNPRHKAIVVSWKAFVAGYADPHDGINLGLHEMAHALKLENVIRNDEHGFFSRQEYDKWLNIADEEIAKIRQGGESIFRAYAGTDEDEFFATGMELYFEQPKQLFEYHPELYKTLSNLLRQDTLQLVG